MNFFDLEGHPASAISEQDEFQTAGKFAKTSYDDVSAYLSPFKEIRLYKGDVRTSMPGLAEASYRFVHVDTDLYGPTKACLEYFAPRMVPGGVFVLEAVSVLLQVAYFKRTGGRRLFLMTPIHHHFQKKGWPATKVVARFWILSLLCGLLGLLSLKLR